VKKQPEMGQRPEIKDIDQVVCQWTMDTGTAVSESALNDLVDRIAALFGIPVPADGKWN
jgi:hypothetical protein